MNLTAEQIDLINNHFTEIPKDMVVFKGLVDVKISDEEKKSCLLAIIDKMEREMAQVKEVIETISD